MPINTPMRIPTPRQRPRGPKPLPPSGRREPSGENDVQRLLVVLRRWNSIAPPARIPRSTRLESGPTCPPHSRPSKIKRRAPCRRNISSKFAEGVCRYVRIPADLERTACSGRPPAKIANRGLPFETTSICSARNSAGRKPEIPTTPRPVFRSPRSRDNRSHSGRRSRPSARNGKPPPCETASANRHIAHPRHGPLQMDSEFRAPGRKASSPPTAGAELATLMLSAI